MGLVAAISFLIVSLSILLIIDRKIKSGRSIITKIISIFLVLSVLVVSAYFYRHSITEVTNVDFKSFSNMRDSYKAKALAIIVILLLIAFVSLKTLLFLTVFKREHQTVIYRAESAILLVSIVLDIFVVPNIAVFVALIILGRLVNKLVFSFASSNNLVNERICLNE